MARGLGKVARMFTQPIFKLPFTAQQHELWCPDTGGVNDTVSSMFVSILGYGMLTF